MKRIVALLLIVATFALLLASCGGGKTDPTKTVETKPTETEEKQDSKYKDDVKDTFGFTQVGVLIQKQDHTISDFIRDAANKETLNDAIYNRNKKVQEKIKIRLKWYEADDEVTEAQTAVLNNMGFYDILMGDATTSYATAAGTNGGYFLNINNAEKNKYIDLDKPYWNSYLADAATIYDKCYCITGSLALSLFKKTFALFFSKSVLADLGKDQMDLFSIVDEGIDSKGGWTFDVMLDTIKNVGNGTDLFGLTMDNSCCIDPFWSAFDLQLMKRSSDGGIEWAQDVTKFTSAETKLKDLMKNNKKDVKVIDCRDENSQFDALGTEVGKYLSDNATLFAVLRLGNTDWTNIKNMDKGGENQGYGIIPLPKYDEYQTNYYSFIQDSFIVFAILKNTTKAKEASATLEVMASVQYADVAPTYYDTILKGQYMNDPYSAEMLDVITQNIKIDFAWVHTFAFTGGMAKVAQVCFREVINGYGSKTSFVTYWNSVRTARESSLSSKDGTGLLDKYKALTY